ncbi:MAG TPA: hypothetical protein VGE39_20480, partial [Prosthecobacter sp.]
MPGAWDAGVSEGEPLRIQPSMPLQRREPAPVEDRGREAWEAATPPQAGATGPVAVPAMRWDGRHGGAGGQAMGPPPQDHVEMWRRLLQPPSRRPAGKLEPVVPLPFHIQPGGTGFGDAGKFTPAPFRPQPGGTGFGDAGKFMPAPFRIQPGPTGLGDAGKFMPLHREPGPQQPAQKLPYDLRHGDSARQDPDAMAQKLPYDLRPGPADQHSLQQLLPAFPHRGLPDSHAVEQFLASRHHPGGDASAPPHLSEPQRPQGTPQPPPPPQQPPPQQAQPQQAPPRPPEHAPGLPPAPVSARPTADHAPQGGVAEKEDREQRLIEERAKARGERRRAAEAAAEEHRRHGEALERAHPGMRARHAALRQQAEAQEKALQQQFPGGPGSSPQAQAAWDALAQDTQRQSQALQQEAQQGHQQSRMQALEAAGAIQARLEKENAENPMGQHGIKDMLVGKKWLESPAEKEQRIQQSRQRQETIIAEEMRRHGLDPQHPGHRELLEDAKKFDWSDAVVPDDKGSGGVEHALKGIARSLLTGKDTTAEATRVLSNGALLVNPMLVQNTQAYTDAVNNSDASAEAKQAALDQLPAMQIRQAGQMVEALEKTPAGMPGEHFNTFVARRGADAQHGAWFQGLSKGEQAREYFMEQQNRGTLSVWTDYLATHLASGVTQVGAMGLGLLAMPLGKVPIAGEALSAAAGVVSDYAGSMTATTDAETGAGAGMRIGGMVTGMAPAAALTFLSGGSALGGALIAGGTAAGGQYAAGYAEAIRNGMTHEQAWKTQATGALATGVVTALLT